MKSAIKPNFFAGLPSFLKDKVAKKGTTNEEKALYAMSVSAGWKIFEEFVDSVLKDVDDINNKAISQGAGFEEIGKNTVVVGIAKGIIKRLLDKVNDAKEACEAETTKK